MMRIFFALLFTLLAAPAHAGEPDLLEADQAFKLSARMLDANTVEVRYRIAEGYYLYREKFKFSADPALVTLGTPRFPPGKIKQDEFLGKMETYRHELAIALPVKPAGQVGGDFTLKVIAQGCADAGVCYPPFPQTAHLTLPAAAAPAASSPFRLPGLRLPARCPPWRRWRG